eukprot:768734-Hanusia_phi.AAC.2
MGLIVGNCRLPTVMIDERTKIAVVEEIPGVSHIVNGSTYELRLQASVQSNGFYIVTSNQSTEYDAVSFYIEGSNDGTRWDYVAFSRVCGSVRTNDLSTVNYLKSKNAPVYSTPIQRSQVVDFNFHDIWCVLPDYSSLIARIVICASLLFALILLQHGCSRGSTKVGSFVRDENERSLLTVGADDSVGIYVGNSGSPGRIWRDNHELAQRPTRSGPLSGVWGDAACVSDCFEVADAGLQDLLVFPTPLILSEHFALEKALLNALYQILVACIVDQTTNLSSIFFITVFTVLIGYREWYSFKRREAIKQDAKSFEQAWKQLRDSPNGSDDLGCLSAQVASTKRKHHINVCQVTVPLQYSWEALKPWRANGSPFSLRFTVECFPGTSTSA